MLALERPRIEKAAADCGFEPASGSSVKGSFSLSHEGNIRSEEDQTIAIGMALCRPNYE